MNHTSLKVALKEWDVVCNALCCGEQHVLLRKGGILESGGEFEIEEKQFLLYPTFIHQDPASLKPAYRQGVADIRTEPEIVHFPGWASVDRIFRVPGRRQIDRLNHLYIWDTPLIDMRFNYRPQYPLYLMLLRTWKFEHRPQVANAIEFAGCKSWVTLPNAIAIQEAIPVCSDEELAGVEAQIVEAFAA